MAGRLIQWPNGLRANFREPMSGPRSIRASENEALDGFVQTTSSPFGLWRFRFSFPSIRGQLFRRYRGWITALHGGANATRVPWCDWDQMSFADRGMVTNEQEFHNGQTWSNGQPWSNGQNWYGPNPDVAVSANAAKGATIINFAGEFWGHNLDMGDMLGFFPFHLGWYMVTERIAAGTYRIWPPLRKAITTDDFGTLNPVMAMRLESENAANAPRGAAFAEGLTVTLLEVADYDVREWFTG